MVSKVVQRLALLLLFLGCTQGLAADALLDPLAGVHERPSQQEELFRRGAGTSSGPPRNVKVSQHSHDGTPIPWAGTAKTTEVILNITGNPRRSPNSCPARGFMEIELREGHEAFTNRRDLPTSRAACAFRDCGVLSATSGFLRLDPGKPYKWQARLTVIYVWEECTNSGCYCMGEADRYRSRWTQVGILGPGGYFSFLTP
ncbi:hypothetical protein [Ensifer aridi]|uniref:hypothetical protein n=1 Tax=Ensifer aridi TaxID=1708715 RepID=UPI001124ED6A|nr:hypothetical protein [Ensifer aridi]